VEHLHEVAPPLLIERRDVEPDEVAVVARREAEVGVRDRLLDGLDEALVRRNAITEGVDLNELIGPEFEVRGVRFRGTEECRPCYWMDRAFGPGAHQFLKGRGGLRARILSDGELSVTQVAAVPG